MLFYYQVRDIIDVWMDLVYINWWNVTELPVTRIQSGVRLHRMGKHHQFTIRANNNISHWKALLNKKIDIFLKVSELLHGLRLNHTVCKRTNTTENVNTFFSQ